MTAAVNFVNKHPAPKANVPLLRLSVSSALKNVLRIVRKEAVYACAAGLQCGIKGNGVKRFIGEIGVLAYVHFRRAPAIQCYLVIDYEHDKFVGALLIDNPAFCEQICKLLQASLGRSIREIGDLDLSHTL